MSFYRNPQHRLTFPQYSNRTHSHVVYAHNTICSTQQAIHQYTACPTKADHTTVLTRNINRNPATSVSISVVFPGNSHDLNSRQVSNVMTGRRTHQYESVESSHSSSLVFIVFCSEASSSSSSVEVSRSSFCRVVGSSSESLSSAMPRVLRRLSSVSAVYIICNTPFHTSWSNKQVIN